MTEVRAARLANFVLGAILSTALIAAFSEDGSMKPAEIAAGAMASAAVFWLGHAYASLLGQGAGKGASAGLREFRSELVVASPLLTSAAVPALLLLLAPAGVVSDYTAENLAIGFGLAVLAACGFLIGRRRGLGVWGTIASIATSTFFGLAIIALKIAIH